MITIKYLVCMNHEHFLYIMSLRCLCHCFVSELTTVASSPTTVTSGRLQQNVMTTNKSQYCIQYILSIGWGITYISQFTAVFMPLRTDDTHDNPYQIIGSAKISFVFLLKRNECQLRLEKMNEQSRGKEIPKTTTYF